MLVCTKTRQIVVPVVYSSVRLRGSRQCTQTLRYLKSNPWVASHIRQLVVDPNYQRTTRDTDVVSSGATEDWVAHVLEELAPHLKRLTDFRWDGSCLPKSRTFWQTLQSECSTLEYISVSISHQDPLFWDDTTSFLKVRDLRGLSVKIKGSSDASSNSRYLSKFPQSFWDMIHPSRSPRLHHLSFDTDILRSFNFNPLFALRLPSLNRLTVGSFVFSDFATRDLVEFLHSARSLEHLEIAPVARIPWAEIDFPNIQHYGGNIFSIFTGATHWSTLTSLDISCFALSFERMTAFLRRTSQLSSLTTFTFRVTSEDVHSAHPNSNFFGDGGDPALGLLPALACCFPNLQSLNMINSSGSTLPWESILVSLKEFTSLNSLHLTQVPPRFGGDIFLLAKAALAANACLHNITVQRSLGPWFNTSDCVIGEKVVLRYFSHRPSEVVSQHMDYRNEELGVSRFRFSV